MEEKKKKYILINYRPLFCVFLGVILGSLLIYLRFVNNKPYIFFIVLGVTITILIASFFVFKFCKISSLKTISKFIFTIFIGLTISVIFTNISFSSISEYPVGKGIHQVSGKIEEVKSYDSGKTLVINNVVIDEDNQNFKIKLSLNNNVLKKYEIDLGYYISFNGNLTALKLFNANKVNSDLIENIKYSASVKQIIKVQCGEKSLTDKFKENVSNKLTANMPTDMANLSYSLLFGEKNVLDGDIYSLFQESGVAHILAVSGLHVSLVTALLIFLLKKIRCNRILNVIIVSGFLLFYAMLCGFTASVCRASIMSLTYLIIDLCGHRRDMLSTFSLAGIIILLISPLQVFTLGFQLSFSCVMGIVLLSRQFLKLFNKTKMPEFLKGSLAITLSSSIATLPIVANVFQKYYPITIISNLIVLPLFSIAFACLFIFTVVNLILPFGFLFKIVEHLFNIIISLCGVFSLTGAIRLDRFSLLSSILYYITLFIASQFINFKLLTKLIVCCLLLTIIGSSFIINNFNKKYDESLLFCNGVENFNILTTEDNLVYIINIGSNGSDYEYNYIKTTLTYRKISKIDGVIITAFDTKSQNNLISLISDYDVKSIIFDSSIDDDLVSYYRTNTNKNVNIVNFETEYQLGKFVTLSTLSYNNIKFATIISVNNKKNLIINKDLTENRVNVVNNTSYDRIVVNETYSQVFKNVFVNNTNNDNYLIKLSV